MTVELVIFDCDGVLVDSEAPVIAAEAALLRRHGVVLTDAEVADLFIGHTERELRAVAADRRIPIPDGFWADRRAAIHDMEILSRVEQVPGIADVIDALGVPFCLASSSSHERITTMLAAAGLLDRFPGARRFSAHDVERGKPAPDLFLHAASSLGAAPADCVVVEDSVPGVRAGIAAGMRVIGLTAGSHCPPGHDAVLRDAGAAEVADCAADLDGLLA